MGGRRTAFGLFLLAASGCELSGGNTALRPGIVDGLGGAGAAPWSSGTGGASC